MIDLHSHVLPGIDDGARNLDESLAILRAAVADGITAIAATPHVRDDYPTGVETMERLVAELRAAASAERLPIEVLSGGEIAAIRLADLTLEELRRFGLGGSARYVLVEFPYYGWPLELRTRIAALREKGFVAVIGHPERNPDVQAEPARLAELTTEGALVQVTAASVDGRLGAAAARTSARLLALGLVHLIASDAHSPQLRAVGISAAVHAIGDAATGRWLSVDVPEAIVAGLPPPPPPARSRTRRFRLSGR